MTRAYIGLGSNLQEPQKQISSAILLLQDIPGTKLLRSSSFYTSKPVGVVDQPDFVNAVAELETTLSAYSLLEKLQSIENEQGRVRGTERWGPRTLDLDILLFGDEQINRKDLVIPHPEIKNRNFVLVPLCELSPGLEIDGLGSIQVMLENISSEGLEKIR